jgi:uncharacterized OB-fold protein
MSSNWDELLPIVPYLGRDAEGEPKLQGSKCGACGEVFLGVLKVCARCGARQAMTSLALGQTGKLYNYTVVHRSLPGVATPFISAIVDLDGGGVVKGNLDASPGQIRFDMPVQVVFERAGKLDDDGRAYLTYHFAPA